MVGAVLDALSAPAGAEDTRSHAQRYHDALQEAMRRLVAADLLPERAGQPVKAWLHIPSPTWCCWTAACAAGGSGRRGSAQRGRGPAAGSAAGVTAAAWLDGDAAAAMGAHLCNGPRGD